MFYYEQAFAEPNQQVQGFIELVEGYMHGLNMAACYTKLGKKEVAMLRVKDTIELLRNADATARNMQSIKLLSNKAISIAQQNQQAVDLSHQQISKDYPLIWMSERDWAFNSGGITAR